MNQEASTLACASALWLCALLVLCNAHHYANACSHHADCTPSMWFPSCPHHGAKSYHSKNFSAMENYAMSCCPMNSHSMKSSSRMTPHSMKSSSRMTSHSMKSSSGVTPHTLQFFLTFQVVSDQEELVVLCWPLQLVSLLILMILLAAGRQYHDSDHKCHDSGHNLHGQSYHNSCTVHGASCSTAWL